MATLTPTRDEAEDPEFNDLSYRLERDLVDAATTLTGVEARYMVAHYYDLQDFRIRSKNQLRRLYDENAPHRTLSWFGSRTDQLEKQIIRPLKEWAEGQEAGRWALSIVGVGPVIAAGLLAHIDIERGGVKDPVTGERGRTPTVGHIWRFAGLDPTLKWEKGQKRPFNADLKVLCYKIGESFVKVQNNPRDIYGHVYAERKQQEIVKNYNGDFADQCAAALARMRVVDKSKDYFYWNSGCLTVENAKKLAEAGYPIGLAKRLAGEPGSGIPMLAPAHIHARARRYAVKLFLSSFFEVLYFSKYGELPPKPYILTQPDHVHWFQAPDPDSIVRGLREAQEAALTRHLAV